MNNQWINSDRLQALQFKLPEQLEIAVDGVQAAVVTEPPALPALMEELKYGADWQFSMLSSLTAVDYKTYFMVVYHLYSPALRQGIVVKCRCERENPRVPSVTRWWPAEFQEREVYDLLGVFFTGHGDLRRILMPDDYSGHPLRKDFQAPARAEKR